MSPISFEQMDKTAASLSTAVHMMAEGEIPKERELFRNFAHDLNVFFGPSNISNWCGRLLTNAHNEDKNNFGPLLPLLSVCDGEAPPPVPLPKEMPVDHPTMYVQELDAAIGEGALQDYFCRQPAVETWVAEQAEQFLHEIRGCLGTCTLTVRGVSDILLATSAAAHDLLAGLSDLCRTHQYEASFTAHCVGWIRNAVMYTVFHRLLDEGIDQQAAGEWNVLAQKVRDELKEICLTRYRPDRLSVRKEADFIRRYLGYLLRAQNEFLLYLANEKNSRHLPLLASLLKEHCGEECRRQANGQRILPWGQCTMMERAAGGRTVIYSADGIQHSSMLAVTDPQRGTHTAIEYALPHEEEGVPAPEVTAISCLLDETGKIYFGGADRFAPPSGDPSQEDARETIRRVNAVMNQRLVAFWERYPGLFGDLSEHGPLLCLRDTPDRMVIFSKTAFVTHLAAKFDCPVLPPEETQRIAKECELRLPPEWSSMAIKLDQENGNGHGMETPPEDSDVSDRAWRKRIRQKTGLKKIPSLEWIVERLKPFGEVEWTTQGKGSHGSVLLVRPTGTERQTIWRRIEGTQSVTWGLLWEFLERLNVRYEQFFESLEEE